MNDIPLGIGYRLTIEREFDAPRQLVFDCFTRAEHLARWWGPRGFDAPVCEADPRSGGRILIHMRGPEPYGTNVVTGEFHEVVPPERLVFTLRGFQGEDGEWGIKHVDTITFEDLGGGRTRMILAVEVTKVSEALKPALEGMREGWGQSFDKLAEQLEEVG